MENVLNGRAMDGWLYTCMRDIFPHDHVNTACECDATQPPQRAQHGLRRTQCRERIIVCDGVSATSDYVRLGFGACVRGAHWRNTIPGTEYGIGLAGVMRKLYVFQLHEISNINIYLMN